MFLESSQGISLTLLSTRNSIQRSTTTAMAVLSADTAFYGREAAHGRERLPLAAS
jgi:hypothetical protein